VTPPAQPDAGGQPGRDAQPPVDDLRRALDSERQRARELEREVRRLADAEAARADASKPELERERSRADRERQRADAAEAKVAVMERDALARQVAAEAGIATLWHRLSGDDVRALRADAGRLREELGLGSGSLDGGVRGVGVPPKPQTMDEIIRAGARRH
jgi:hypothetical protein